MKLRYFYKLDRFKKPIPGSNIRRKSKPTGESHRWKEISLPCCTPVTIPCNCGPRFFVQIDNLNKPVDGTLIKRVKKPEEFSTVRYSEVQWMSDCCILDISTFLASVIGPFGDIFDASGTGIYNGNLTTSITLGESFQLEAITYVEYFVNGVSIGTVQGNGIDNPLHNINHNFTLSGDVNQVFNYYSIIHFTGGITYTTDTESFTLIYNSPPIWSNIFNTSNYIKMVMSEDTTAQIASWAVNPNPDGPSAIVLTYDGLPDFAETPEEENYAGARLFKIRLNPAVGDAGSYPITIHASNGVHSISHTVTLLVDTTVAGTYAPIAYPYAPAEEVETFIENADFDDRTYNKISTRQVSFTVGDGHPNTLSNIFGVLTFSSDVTLFVDEYTGYTGEGLFLNLYGGIADPNAFVDTWFVKVNIIPE